MDSGKKFGVHVFKRDDMVRSIEYAIEKLGVSSVQIFSHGPRGTKKIKSEEAMIKHSTTTKNVNVYVHSSYPTNPWNGKESIMEHTKDQFKSSRDMGSKGVVLHIPKIKPDEVARGTKQLADFLIEDNLLDSQKIILEMKAVSPHPTKSYESPEKINKLIEELKNEGLNHNTVGICIDTAHIYAGKANIKKYKDGLEYFKKINHPEWIYLIHLNGNVYDSSIRSGDKHAIPFDNEDKIWSGSYNQSGCRAFIEFAEKNNIDTIFEIKEHHTYDELNKFLKHI